MFLLLYSQQSLMEQHCFVLWAATLITELVSFFSYSWRELDGMIPPLLCFYLRADTGWECFLLWGDPKANYDIDYSIIWAYFSEREALAGVWGPAKPCNPSQEALKDPHESKAQGQQSKFLPSEWPIRTVTETHLAQLHLMIKELFISSAKENHIFWSGQCSISLAISEFWKIIWLRPL